MIRKINDIAETALVYASTPGASAFSSGVVDVGDYGAVHFELIACTTGETSVTAVVQECATTNGTYSTISGSTFALDGTVSGGALYTSEVFVGEEFVKVSVSSTPTANVPYVITARKHSGGTLPQAG